MKAAAALVAEPGEDGATRLPVVRSQAPLILRRTPDAVYLVAGRRARSAATSLELRIDVRAGATLRLRAVAASVALPGRDGRESVLEVTATVGAGRPAGVPARTHRGRGRGPAPHRDAGPAGRRGRAHLRDEVILGRHGERGGSCRTRLHVDLAGQPLLRHELDVSGTGEASLGPAVLAGHRAAGSLLCVEPAWGARPADQRPAGYGPGVARHAAGRAGRPRHGAGRRRADPAAAPGLAARGSHPA